jgi:hypothetical protein
LKRFDHDHGGCWAADPHHRADPASGVDHRQDPEPPVIEQLIMIQPAKRGFLRWMALIEKDSILY